MERITKVTEPGLFSFHFFEGNLHRLGEADNTRDVKRAGAKPALMATAVNHRCKWDFGVASAARKDADSFWAVNLVR